MDYQNIERWNMIVGKSCNQVQDETSLKIAHLHLFVRKSVSIWRFVLKEKRKHHVNEKDYVEKPANRDLKNKTVKAFKYQMHNIPNTSGNL